MGHPRVWLSIPQETGFVECGYCDKRYVIDRDHAHDDHGDHDSDDTDLALHLQGPGIEQAHRLRVAGISRAVWRLRRADHGGGGVAVAGMDAAGAGEIDREAVMGFCQADGNGSAVVEGRGGAGFCQGRAGEGAG